MGGGKSQTSTQTVSIPPDVLARYNSVNAQAQQVAQQPFQQYGGEFVAGINPTQQAGIQATTDYSQAAQPYYGAATGLTMNAAQGVGPLTQGQIGYYQNPAMLATLAPTAAALQQQQGQQLAQQQAQAIQGGAFGGDRANLQRAQLMGQQQLGMGQALAPIYQQAYQTGLQTATQQQGVEQQNLALQMQAAQQLGGLGTAAQQAALQGAQAQIGAGTLQQQTQQAQDTAQYQQFLQERGYPFQVAQFLANIAEGTGALSGSTTTTNQPSSFFSDRRLKHDAKKIGETKDGLPIYSFKYNGDDRTQIGLMAQDVEKKRPEAVGLAGGYKTVDYEKALRPARKAYGGGLDPNSMGGAVSEPGAFERGGYADGGVSPTDLSAILAQQRQSFGPFGQAGLYGQSQFGVPNGASGIVPQQQMHVPRLMTAGAAPKPADSEFSQIYNQYQKLNGIANDMTGKGLSRRAGDWAFGTDAVKDAKGNVTQPAQQGFFSKTFGAANNTVPESKSGIAPPVQAPQPVQDTSAQATASAPAPAPVQDTSAQPEAPQPQYRGGLVRHHYADGGSSVDPYAPPDASKGYIAPTIEDEDKNKTPDMLKPGGGLGSKSGGLGSDIMGAAGLIGAGNTLASAGSGLGSFLANALPFIGLASGGVVPRQHFDDGGSAVIPDDAVQNQPGLVPVSDDTSDTGIPSRMQALAATGADKAAPDYRSIVLKAANDAGIDPVDSLRLVKAESGFKPQSGDDGSSGSIWQLHVGGLSKQYPNPGKGDDYFAERRPDLASKLSPAEKIAYLNDPQNQEDISNYAANHIAKNGAGAWTQAHAQGLFGLPASSSGVGGIRPLSSQTQTSDATEKPGFFDGIGFNKQTIIPLLEGLAGMAGSRSRFLGSAILEGLGTGAKGYADLQAQQAGVQSTEAGTTQTQAQTQAVLANIAKGSGIYAPDGRLTGYRVYVNGRITTVPVDEFRRAFLAGNPYQTAPEVGGVGGVNAPAPAGRRTEISADGTTTLPPDQNPVQQIQPGLSYDKQAHLHALNDASALNITPQESQNVKAAITKGAIAASENNGIVNDLAKNTANLISDTVGGTGTAANRRAQILTTANTIYRLATGENLPEGYDGSNVAINGKIQSYLAGLQTTSTNQNNALAFGSALKGAPNAELPPKALAEISSLILLKNSKDKELMPFADRYGNDANGNLSGNVYTEYQRLHGRQMQSEQTNMADMFQKYPKFVQKVASGEIPYDVAQQTLQKVYPNTPYLARHITNR